MGGGDLRDNLYKNMKGRKKKGKKRQTKKELRSASSKGKRRKTKKAEGISEGLPKI
jgi:hypothetical protein